MRPRLVHLLFSSLVLACSAEPTVAPPHAANPSATAPQMALVPLDPFGIGAKIPGSRGCQAEPYRQFDFWVGNWDVFGPAAGSPLRSGYSSPVALAPPTAEPLPTS